MFNVTNNKYRITNSAAGQTLIETMVAIFILVMGVTAATGLAVYALSSSTNITKQIVGTGLAREGIEAVKNMRDTNWLKLTLSNSCYDFASGANDGSCYDTWLDKGGTWNNSSKDRGFRMDPGASATYTLKLDTDPTNKAWVLNSEGSRFGLNFNSSGIGGFYVPANALHGSSDYYRTITLNKYTTAPYDQAHMERIEVISQVWWTDKKCPRVTTYAAANAACRVELRTFLTNWRNY